MLSRSSAAVATRREGHYRRGSDQEVRHRQWGRECQAVGGHEI